MFLINPLNYMNLDGIKYIFGAFGFFGLMLCIQKLILNKKV